MTRDHDDKDRFDGYQGPIIRYGRYSLCLQRAKPWNPTAPNLLSIMAPFPSG